MPKKKTLLSKKRPGRSKPRYDSSNYIDLQTVGLSGAGGAIGGALAGRAYNESKARKSVARDASYRLGSYDGAFGAAQSVHKGEYDKMPRVDSNKVSLRNKLRSEAVSKYGQNAYGKDMSRRIDRAAGITRSDRNKLRAKRNAKINPAYATGERYLREASELRAKRTSRRATVRGAAIGGLSAAALSAIVQAVSNELKKRR